MNRIAYADAVLRDSPGEYLRSLGFDPYRWQGDILDSEATRIIVNGARQAGKSTLMSGLPCHKARFSPGSLSIIIAADEKQAVEDMGRVRGFMSTDSDYPEITRASDELVQLENDARVVVVTGTVKAARGYSHPQIIMLDEASRIEDEVYASGVRAMLTNNPGCRLIAISTPFGKLGWFYRAWTRDHWERYEVRAPWDIEGASTLVAAEDEVLFSKRCKAKGIRGYYSPRHLDWTEQQENLDEMGELWYRQEMMVEFVSTNQQAFDTEDVDAMMHPTREIRPLRRSGLRDAGVSPLARR